MEVSLSISTIIIGGFALYYIIKSSVKKALIEAKVYEHEMTMKIESDKAFNDLAKIIGGDYGFGTTVFNNIDKEEKKKYRDEWKSYSKRFNKIYLLGASGNDDKFHQAVNALRADVDQFVAKMDRLRESSPT